MESTLDEAHYFDGFTTSISMVREGDVYEDLTNMSQDTTFADRCKALARFEVNHFDEDNQIMYTLLHVTVANCYMSYCDKHETKKNGKESWKELVDYYYGLISYEKDILNI